MTADEKARTFRALHHADGCFVIPNPWDRGSARMLANLGFKALATTSAGHAFSIGVLDGQLDRVRSLDHCREIVDATALPVSADLENGFGHDPEAVADTIRDAAATGLAGCSIEDHTGSEADPIYDLARSVERVAAAVEAGRGLDRDFVLTARAENYLHGRLDLDDTITRLQAYESAGADVLYAPGIRDIDQIRTVCAALSRPVNVIMGIAGVHLTVSELAEAGVKRVSVGSGLMRAAYGTMIRAAEEMLGDGSFGYADTTPGFARFNELLTPPR